MLNPLFRTRLFAVGTLVCATSCASLREGTHTAPLRAANSATAQHTIESELDDSDLLPVGHSPVRGRRDARVTVVVFSDFQCPFCLREANTMRALQEQFGDDIRIVWKNHPLNYHRFANLAAQAAMEAYAQGGSPAFWRFHDKLFENQPALSRELLEQIAQEEQLDLDRFNAALDQGAHSREIEDDMTLADQLGVHSTPQAFVNGLRISGAKSPEVFASVIAQVLDRAREIPVQRSVYASMTRDAFAAVTSDLAASAPGATVVNDAHNAVPSVATGGNVLAMAPPTQPSLNAARGQTGAPANGSTTSHPRYHVSAGATTPMRGSANAPIVIDVFSDFQCPFCGRAVSTIEAVMQAYPTQVRLVWHDFPLAFHQNAHLAAEAAREAYNQKGNNGFWAFHDLMFHNQTELDRRALERYARTVGLDLTRFRRALDTHFHAAIVDKDIAAAGSTGVISGTPTFLINGLVLEGAQPITEFSRVINGELQKLGLPVPHP